ncbi:MAG: internal scaffolding protein [Microviridae sp.]|nr:MAG: internal scaffolding protein [Microviridae sp.]
MFKVPFFRSGFNDDSLIVSDSTGLRCDDVSLAVQAAAEECDINTIVRRFGLSGELPSGLVAPTYGDFTGVVDYRSAIDAVRSADDAFMQMPAAVRSRFDNDPQGFVEFCSNPDNRDEMLSLGLIESPKPSEPVQPVVASAEVK